MSRVSAGLNADDVEVLTAARSLIAEESGKTFILEAAAGFNVTLPTPSKGLSYKFVVGTKIVSNAYVVISRTTNLFATIAGPSLSAGVTTIITSSATAQFRATIGTNAVKADNFTIVTDGTSWFMSGVTAAYTGVVLATS